TSRFVRSVNKSTIHEPVLLTGSTDSLKRSNSKKSFVHKSDAVYTLDCVLVIDSKRKVLVQRASSFQWSRHKRLKGTRIIYDRKFLLDRRNSPIAQTPPAHLPVIPGVTSKNVLNENKRNEANNIKNHDAKPGQGEDAQFEMDI
uniref:Eukaryotic translation initiation factor 4E binding protein 2 n=1 Tax=Cyprinus carpio carpio TaxID=630221 RepID=A0A9J7ZZ44_CYPCA